MYETRCLSVDTWPDFEKLFCRGNGWDFCWCIAFHRLRRPSRAEFHTRAEVSAVNRDLKRALVDEGRAHGTLVYADGEPVGWCQFGSTDELHGRRQDPETARPTWRITCFVVDRRYRRRGVAGVALDAALEAIRQRGGGIVEAYPVVSWTHGPEGTDRAVDVDGVGPVGPAWGGFNNVSTSGVVSRCSPTAASNRLAYAAAPQNVCATPAHREIMW